MTAPPTPATPPTPRSGFTLIEVLVVAAIAAIVVSLASAGLHSVAVASAFARTKAELVHMDASGRMHARASGESVTLKFDVEGRTARLIGDRSRERLAQVNISLDIGLAIRLPSPGPSMQSLRFDRRGTSGAVWPAHLAAAPASNQRLFGISAAFR